MVFVGLLLLLLALLLFLHLLTTLLGVLDTLVVFRVDAELVVWVVDAAICAVTAVHCVGFLEFVRVLDANEVAAVIGRIFDQLTVVQALFEGFA